MTMEFVQMIQLPFEVPPLFPMDFKLVDDFRDNIVNKFANEFAKICETFSVFFFSASNFWQGWGD